MGVIKIWLDDIREMPITHFNVHAKTVHDAMMYIRTGEVAAISFDHDLGTEETGYDLAKFVEKLAYNNEIPRISWNVHSQNPVGAANIRAAMKKADQYWEGHEKTLDK